MNLVTLIKDMWKKPARALGALTLAGSLALSSPTQAQEVNTTDSLLWGKQAVRQTVENAHNALVVPDVRTTYTLLDTLNAPDSLRSQTFFTDENGAFIDSVWTEFVNPDYDPSVGIDDVFADAKESLSLFFDGSQYRFEGLTSIRPEQLNIFSLQGSMVASERVANYDPGSGESQASFPLAHLSPGAYILNVNNNPAYSLKFVKLQDGIAPYGTTTEIGKSAEKENGFFKYLLADDEPITKRYERVFENTHTFFSFPTFTDTVAIPKQDEVFATTTAIPDMKYIYETSFSATPNASLALDFLGEDTTSHNLTVPADSMVSVPTVEDKDNELLLRAIQSKAGYDTDTTSWTIPFGEHSLLEMYIAKTKLPHSFSGGAHEGTNIEFMLPDTTITAIANENNVYQTDTIWDTDSTWYDVQAYALLDNFPAISETFDAPFGDYVKDFFVDTTSNGFNLIFKGYPQTSITAVNTANDDTLFSGKVAADSLVRAPGYASLDDALNVTVQGSLPWHHDSTLLMSDVLPGTTLQELFLQAKTYDFSAELSTNPDVMVTGSFGGRDIDTLYSDVDGNVTFPSQTFFQPDSLQEVNLLLQRDFFADKDTSFIARPGQNEFIAYLDSLYHVFDIGITTTPDAQVSATFDGAPLSMVIADENGKAWLPRQRATQPDSLHDVSLLVEKEFYVSKDTSFTAHPDTTKLEALLENMYYTFIVGIKSQPDVTLTGTLGGEDIGTVVPDNDTIFWLPQHTTIQPDSLLPINISITYDENHYPRSITGFVRPDTTVYDAILNKLRYGKFSASFSREDGQPLGEIELGLTNIQTGDLAYSTHLFDGELSEAVVLLSDLVDSTAYELNVGDLLEPPQLQRLIDTIYLKENQTTFYSHVFEMNEDPATQVRVVFRDATTGKPIDGVSARLREDGSSTYVAEKTAQDSTILFDVINPGDPYYISAGFPGSSNYFARTEYYLAPSTATEVPSIGITLLKKRGAVPGTYDEETNQSDSLDVSLDNLFEMMDEPNWEYIFGRSLLLYTEFLQPEPYANFIDDVLATGHTLFGLPDSTLVKSETFSNFPALDDYDPRDGLTPPPVSLSYFDKGDNSTPRHADYEGESGVVFSDMSFSSAISATRQIFGDLFGFDTVTSRESYMNGFATSPTPEDRMLFKIINDSYFNYYIRKIDNAPYEFNWEETISESFDE